VIKISLTQKVREIYAKYNFRASPVLDQFFIINKGVIERVVRYANVNKNDIILEVGPGLGFLTKEIAEKAGKVIAIERDKKLIPVLESELKDYDNVELIFKDVLKTKLPKFNKIVSNIPYSISAPLSEKLLNYDFELAVLFFQKEFGYRMIKKPGQEGYGRLSVMAQHYNEVEVKETVPRDAFYPQPKVDSVIVLLKRKKEVTKDDKFNLLVKEIFRYKNKTVKNAVKIAFNKNIEDERKVRTLKDEDLMELIKQVMD